MNQEIEMIFESFKKDKHSWNDLELNCGEKVNKITLLSFEEDLNKYLLKCSAKFSNSCRKVLLVFSKDTKKYLRSIAPEECLYCSSDVDILDLYNTNTDSCRDCAKSFD